MVAGKGIEPLTRGFSVTCANGTREICERISRYLRYIWTLRNQSPILFGVHMVYSVVYTGSDT